MSPKTLPLLCVAMFLTFPQDYLTEKFWKILNYDLIPIVLNGVDMATVAPPHSYIDIKDFKSFEGLYFFENI